MTFLRPLGALLLLVSLTGGLSGCLSAPTYPIEPGIDFQDLTVVRFVPPNRQAPVDTFKIRVSFKDGDGDLGLTQAEIGKPPYTGLNQYNYYVRLFRRVPPSKQFEELFPQEYFSNYPPLNVGAGDKSAPLKGDLTYRLPLTLGSPLNVGDEVQFTLSIKDRALHESNTITTDIKTIAPR